jgi:hypothetical protein
MNSPLVSGKRMNGTDPLELPSDLHSLDSSFSLLFFLSFLFISFLGKEEGHCFIYDALDPYQS